MIKRIKDSLGVEHQIDYNELANKPTKVSEFENDKKFTTEDYVIDKIRETTERIYVELHNINANSTLQDLINDLLSQGYNISTDEPTYFHLWTPYMDFKNVWIRNYGGSTSYGISSRIETENGPEIFSTSDLTMSLSLFYVSHEFVATEQFIKDEIAKIDTSGSGTSGGNVDLTEINELLNKKVNVPYKEENPTTLSGGIWKLNGNFSTMSTTINFIPLKFRDSLGNEYISIHLSSTSQPVQELYCSGIKATGEEVTVFNTGVGVADDFYLEFIGENESIFNNLVKIADKYAQSELNNYYTKNEVDNLLANTGPSIPDDRIYVDYSATNFDTLQALIDKMTSDGFATQEPFKKKRYYITFKYNGGQSFIFVNFSMTYFPTGVYNVISIIDDEKFFKGDITPYLTQGINNLINAHKEFLNENSTFITNLIARIEALENGNS